MRIRSILNVLGVVLLVAVVVPFGIYAVPGAIGADASYVVLSGSMEPSISAGDVVVVAETDPSTIAAGDVITFDRGDGNAAVTHRVVGITEGTSGLAFETKGDANSDADANPVPAAAVVGTVVLTIPYIGYVILATNSSLGFVLLVVLPFVLLGVTELWALVTASRDAPDSEPDAGEGAVEPSTETETETGTISVTAADLTMTTGVLLLAIPYAIYVALAVRTALTVSVAFAATFTALAAAGLWLRARSSDPAAETATTRADDGTDDPAGDPTPSTDGGTIAEED